MWKVLRASEAASEEMLRLPFCSVTALESRPKPWWYDEPSENIFPPSAFTNWPTTPDPPEPGEQTSTLKSAWRLL
jgi:hypothetical protein